MRSKQEIRALMKRREADFPSGKAEAETEAFWTGVERSADFISADTILLYMAIPGEIPTEGFISKWLGRKRIAIPKVTGDTLELREYSPGYLQRGYKGIAEPTDEASPIQPSEIDFAVIPGVAFAAVEANHGKRSAVEANYGKRSAVETPNGKSAALHYKRLGRGKGFYDRLLPLLSCPCIPAAFSFRFLDELPTEEHDRIL